MRKKLVPEEKPIYNVVTVYREKGHYLQRLEQFEKAILAYNEALRWNNADVRSLLGRSLARAKATHYADALRDAACAAELEPENQTALQIRAQTNYEKCAFERAYLLASRGQVFRKYPAHFAECARCAEETIRDCTGKSATKVLSLAKKISEIEWGRESTDLKNVPIRKPRLQPHQSHQMAHDKYFLTQLCKDERIYSANKLGSKTLQELAYKALADVDMRQEVLRERRPLYAARGSDAEARNRLSNARKERLANTQRQHIADAERLIRAAQSVFEQRNTAKCLEIAEFAMEQISRKPNSLLPGKEKFIHQLQEVVGQAFLDQKRVGEEMSEANREKRAFILLGIAISREPSRDSILRVRPPAPPRDAKRRLRGLERALSVSNRASERCYVLHELCRLHADTKQAHRAKFFALKCQAEARSSKQRVWLLNITFLLARCHLLQNNRPETRAALIEGAGIARACGYRDVAAFFETCVNVSMEGEVASGDGALEKRERAMVSLMPDNDMRLAAQHLFRKMSVIPASRRFSIMPGTRTEEATPSVNRRPSIAPPAQPPTRFTRKTQHPLGFQDFDI
ncbi:uncharacterized protein LOC123708490 isoform X2 [Pieris brassicae]|uniref:uncharacterized protein LOC123708490 isoform X2 n=1 Tax=Pieris brassicae TaxID=7116 RepID=UPI001E661C74|nr:uncharacterized protein LOC123708490 isoform X2 [Pieris brassicae]